jgi:two-component system sensor histidine kinase HydH
MPIGLIALDSNLKIAAFNQIAESVLQLSSGNVVGKKAERILPAEILEHINNLKIENGVVELEIDCRIGNSQIVPLEIGASPLKNENGIFLGYVILFKDMTEVHALRHEISRNQRLASVGRLAAGVAHEIRNPLSSIKGFATYFKERYQDISEDFQNANIMIQEVDRLNRVISQLLEFARPVTLSPQSIDFQTIIDDSIKLVEKLAKDKSIVIIKKDIEKINRVTVDPDRISQVLLNLYLNAIEAMDDGGELVVSISLDKGREAIVIRISDTGRGIGKDDLANIFDPYFTTKSTGTGLGLAIAHNVIEAIGGEIEVESRQGHGTTFRIIIPLSGDPYL